MPSALLPRAALRGVGLNLSLCVVLLGSSTVAGAAEPLPVHVKGEASDKTVTFPLSSKKKPPKAKSSYEKRLTSKKGEPIPKGYVLEERYRPGLLALGLPVFLLSWSVAAVGSGYQDSSALMIPVMGPLIADTGGGGAGVILALVEAVGLGLVVAGVTPTKVLVKQNESSLHVVPAVVGDHAYGLQAFATF